MISNRGRKIPSSFLRLPVAPGAENATQYQPGSKGPGFERVSMPEALKGRDISPCEERNGNRIPERTRSSFKCLAIQLQAYVSPLQGFEATGDAPGPGPDDPGWYVVRFQRGPSALRQMIFVNPHTPQIPIPKTLNLT